MRKIRNLNSEMKRITNVMLFLGFLACGVSATAQIYNPNDKEGLRIFLRQASAEAGKINAEQLGLQISDTTNWQTDESWVAMLAGLTWNTEDPKRLTNIGDFTDWSTGWYNKNLAGALDASNWTALTSLMCYYNQLTNLDVNNNTALTGLHCGNNQLTTLDVSNNTALIYLNCRSNQLTTLDVSGNTV